MLRKSVLFFVILIATMVLIFIGNYYYGRPVLSPDYHLSLQKHVSPAKPIQAGFSKRSISPRSLDEIWIAGFGHGRQATSSHDPLWARSMVLKVGGVTLAWVSIDAIGMFYQDVIDIRKALHTVCDYVMVSATHTHQAPDIIGIWGETEVQSGVNKAYLDYVKAQVVSGVQEAVRQIEPASLHFSQVNGRTKQWLEDTRLPHVLDEGLRMMYVRSKKTNQALGSLLTWACHPETLWSDNTAVSSDFVHYLRDSLDSAVGGVTVYINGAIGGLLTTSDTFPIQSRQSGKVFTQPSFEKARALGQNLARVVIETMKKNEGYDSADLSLRVETIRVPLDNRSFRLAIMAGIINRGLIGFKREVRTELAAIKLGPATFITIPGEIYPEIVNGGIVSGGGADYQIGPIEVPPLREKMAGKYKFVLGLTNDFLGYIIPKSQWDRVAPFDPHPKRPYGEINSLGPETAPIIYRQLSTMLKTL